MNQDISFMSTVEDTGTKRMFIMHFGRHNWIGKWTIYKLSYEILDCDLLWKSGHLLLPLWQYFFSILSQQQHINMQITA